MGNMITPDQLNRHLKAKGHRVSTTTIPDTWEPPRELTERIHPQTIGSPHPAGQWKTWTNNLLKQHLNR